MKIADVKVYVTKPPDPHQGGPFLIFARLRTDEGITGVGECTYHCRLNHVAGELAKDIGARFVVGADPFRIERLFWEISDGRGAERPGPLLSPVLSAFEMACWDIVGKATHQPVYNLLGGVFNERLRTYSYLRGYDHGASPEKIADIALEYVERGFTAVKVDPFPPRPPDASLEVAARVLRNPTRLDELRYAEDIIRTVREAVGDRCDILIGTHGQFTTDGAIRFAKRIEDYDPMWFEEPVPPANMREMARVARSTSIPIATGERLLSKYEFNELLRLQAAQIVQMDLSIVGGLLEGKKIAALAEVHYATIAPHMYGGPVASAADVQLSVCSPNFLIQEGIETWGGLAAEILEEPIVWKDGYIIPPDKPGLGVELNEEYLSKYGVVC
jgi:2-dehydro-3-deoxyphosphogalactonate aldolase